MIDDDGIEVYLKPTGNENEYYGELEDNHIEPDDGSFKAYKCHFIADGQAFTAVIKFSKKFKLYSATAVQVVAGFGGTGQEVEMDRIDRVIQRTWVQDQQHTFQVKNGEELRIKESKGEKWPKFSKLKRGADHASLQLGSP